MARQKTKLLVCLDNEGHEASLERRKIYLSIPDTSAEKHGLVRVIDESGEDYLHAKSAFREIALPQSLRRAVMLAA
ncbi:MAG: hypothetical protein AB7O88_01420 [Reyranellaceae bacterium]